MMALVFVIFLGLLLLNVPLAFAVGIGSLFFVIAVIGCFPKRRTKFKLVNYIPAIFITVMYMALAGMDSYGLFYYILLAGVSALCMTNVNENNAITA